MIIDRIAKDTLTPVEMNYGDVLNFTRRDGQTITMELISTYAEILESEGELVRRYRFGCSVLLDGMKVDFERIIPAHASFYEPYVYKGMRIWFDAVSDIFIDDVGFMYEKDTSVGIMCMPNAKARFAVNDVSMDICPQTPVDWYSNSGTPVDMSSRGGEYVWMGPYEGRLAHGGVDILVPPDSRICAPIDFDDHLLFDSPDNNAVNSRWRGIRRWENGSMWWLQIHHLANLIVPEGGPLKQGTHYAYSSGSHLEQQNHCHFVFRVFEESLDYFLDPCIFFWSIYRNKGKA